MSSRNVYGGRHLPSYYFLTQRIIPVLVQPYRVMKRTLFLCFITKKVGTNENQIIEENVMFAWKVGITEIMMDCIFIGA